MAGDSEVMRAMMAGTPAERDAYINRVALRATIMRDIFCPITGAVLDIRSAVLIAVHRDSAEGPLMTEVVMTGAAYDDGGQERVDTLKATMAERGVTVVTVVTDGRDYTAKGTLTAKARARLGIS